MQAVRCAHDVVSCRHRPRRGQPRAVAAAGSGRLGRVLCLRRTLRWADKRGLERGVRLGGEVCPPWRAARCGAVRLHGPARGEIREGE